MKKVKKLLSVLLAVLMAVSTCSIVASAYTKEYKTSDDVLAFNGYNSIDTVTRIPIDVRSDMILDWLDELLAGMNINVDLSIVGTLDARSVDSALDSLVGIRGGAIFGIAAGLNMLGDVGDLSVSSIETYRRTSADTGSQYVLYSLFGFLNDNVGILQKVVDGTINFGNILGQVVAPYESYIRDIPGLVKGMIAPMFERKDDTTAEADAIAAAASMDTLVKDFVIGLFTKPQSTTTYKESAEGECISNHTLPTSGDGLRYYYEKSGDSITCYVYDPETKQYVAEDQTFDKTEEKDATGATVYTYRKASGEALKYYENGSYWLPSLATSGKAAQIMDITGNTPAKMLYDMIPYVFAEMAPVVLNGSVKMLLAKWFGAKFEEIGTINDPEVKALGLSEDFLDPNATYLWEYSDYEVVGGKHYYRFEDKVSVADLSDTTEFFNLFKYDWEITDDFINEFIPASASSSSDTLLAKLNNIVGKFFDEMVDADVLGYTWVKGDNSKLPDNIRGVAKALLKLSDDSAEKIFQGVYDKELVDLICDDGVSNTRAIALMLAFLAKNVMPQLIIPDYSEITSMGQVGAIVVRELATQLIPGNNFDSLIYTDYNTKKLASHTDAEWVDIILTMGSQIGIFYLNNICDLELTDPELGGYVESKTWSDADLTISGQPTWEASVDFIIDWALEDDNGATGAWKMRNLVTTDGLTIDRNTVQDPWEKLDKIIFSLLPIDEILNVTPSEYSTRLEQALRGNLVDAILNLDVNKLVGMFTIPDSSFVRTQNLLPAIFYIARKLINNIGQFGDASLSDVVPESMSTIDSVLSKTGLSTLVGNLIPRLNEKSHALVDTFVPILNYFIGWKVDDQEFDLATVSAVRYFNGSNVDTNITVKNNANGMESQYGAAGQKAYDEAYKIKIISATASVDGITVEVPSEPISAGMTAQLHVTGTNEKAQGVVYTIKYQILGLKGDLLANGATFTATAYSYLALTDSDENVKVGEASQSGGTVTVKRDDHNLYIFTKDVYASVTNTVTGFQNMYTLAAVDLNGVNTDAAPAGDAANYFRHATQAEVDSEMHSIAACNTILSVAGMGMPGQAHLWKVKDGVSASDIPYGYYDMGQIAVKFKRGVLFNKSLTDHQVFVYYTDYGLEDLLNSVIDEGITADQMNLKTQEAQAAWNEFQSALAEAASLIKMPYVASTMVSEWMPKAKASYDRLTAAREGINKYYDNADISGLVAEYAEVDDVNYQNVPFYRYAKFEKAKRAADAIIAGQTAPAAPEKYISDAGLSADQIDAVLAAETDEFTKSLVTNTVVEPDTAAYEAELANWKAANLTPVEVAVATEKLTLAHERVLDREDYNAFLKTEIAAAKANVTSGDIYTAKSYARYTEALANAEKVAQDSSARNDAIFAAKYELMVARKALVKTADLADTSNLEALYKKALDMLANHDNYKVKDEYDGEDLDAWTQLLVATGYKSKAADTLDSQLYSGSANYYLDKEVVDNLYYNGKLSDCAERLQAAIDNFEANAVADIFPKEEGTEGQDHNGVVDTDHNDGVHMGGYLYGITPGQDVEEVFGSHAKLNVVANDKGVKNGTGAIVQVMNGEQVVAEYVVIIFGDVNGDGVVDTSDSTAAKRASVGTSTLEGAYNFACDVTGDGSSDTSDSAMLKRASVGTATISTNPFKEA